MASMAVTLKKVNIKDAKFSLAYLCSLLYDSSGKASEPHFFEQRFLIHLIGVHLDN